MPFKQNNTISNDNSQSLNDILTAIHQLKSSIDNLNQRLNKLESTANNKQIESISANSEQLKKDIDKVSNNSAIQFLIILAITVVILIGGIVSSGGTFLLRLMLSISISTKKSLRNKILIISDTSIIGFLSEF